MSENEVLAAMGRPLTGRKTRWGGLVRIFQVCLSAALLGVLFFKVDMASAGAAIVNANPLFLALSVVQLGLLILIGALRWEIVVRTLGGSLPFRAALRYVWIGVFFNQMLPTSVGGDVVRIWLYWRRCGSRRIAIHSVALERLVMVIILLVVVLAAQSGLAARGVPPVIVLAAAAMLLSMLALLTGLLLTRRFLAAHDRWLPLRALAWAAADMRTLLVRVPVSVALCSLCVATIVNVGITVWLIGAALGLQLDLADCAVLVPVLLLAATLPISVGGWGMREGAAIALLGLVGVSSSDALALSVLLGLAGVVVSVPGALLWLVRERDGWSDADALERRVPACPESAGDRPAG